MNRHNNSIQHSGRESKKDSPRRVSMKEQMKRDNVFTSTRISLKQEELQQYEDRCIDEIRNKED